MKPDTQSNIKNPRFRLRPLDLGEIAAELNELLALGEEGVIAAADAAICQAILHEASDVHLEPWRDCVAVRFRLDGQLRDVAEIKKPYQDRFLTRLKVLANIVTYYKDVPQDGRIDPHPLRLNRTLRVATFPTIYGEKLVVRILDAPDELLSPDALGFSEEIVGRLRELVSQPQGTLLLTGPSSSGKTTTIYALLKELMNSTARSRHIVTIEDPVEYQLGRVGQAQVNPATEFTFQKALRALLRQDPDVIMVGEIRDAETAHTAVQAGLTGHLVISTIHSGTAAGVFTRLLDMGMEPFLIASSITGVLAQRLVRVNCAACSEPYDPDARLLAQYGLKDSDKTFMRGAGCDVCRRFGIVGREAIGELLVMTETIAELVLERSRTRVIHDSAVAAGMVPLLDAGLKKVRAGKTTLEELAWAVPPRDE